MLRDGRMVIGVIREILKDKEHGNLMEIKYNFICESIFFHLINNHDHKKN